MTSEAPYLHCRLCGVRYRSDQVIDHERQCSYQPSNSRSSSRESGQDQLAPIPSRDSWANQFRDSQEYYAKAAKASQEKLIDPKSNEESVDSPLNMTNRGGSTRVQEISDQSTGVQKTSDQPTESQNRPAPRDQKTPTAAGQGPRENHDQPTDNQSTLAPRNQKKPNTAGQGQMENHDQPNKTPEPTSWEIPSTEGQNATEWKEVQDQPVESPDRSPNAPVAPSTAGAGSSNNSDQTEENEGGSKSGSLVIPFPEQKRSPPTLSSSSSERKTAHHQLSHSKNKIPYGASPDKGKVSPQASKEEQKREMARTPYPSEEDIKIPDERGVEPADILEHLPELSKHEQQSFEKHQRSLVPCSHCGRTFRPDRLAVHQKACIERPKTREYIGPKDKK